MKALFVNACVRENSRTRLLCDAYIRKCWQGQDVGEREVAAEPLLSLDMEGLQKRDEDITAGNLSGGRMPAPGSLPRPTKFLSARRIGTAPFPLC